MALTDTTIRNAKRQDKQYRLVDGDGLHLLVMPNGSKYWQLRYRFAGKEKLLALGVYPTISLAEARERRMAARKQLANDIDPGQAKKESKRQVFLQTQNSFELVAREWHEGRTLGWTPHHAKDVIRRLEMDIFPPLGNRPINEITAPELLEAIRLIEKRGAIDIAHRAVQTCGQIFRYAIATGRAERNPAADLKGALRTRAKGNYSYLKASELPEFLSKLAAYDGHIQTKLALRLLLLTFVRTSELRAAEWVEINFEKAEWRIPAERMKMREQHIVPLSRQALALLQELYGLTGHTPYVFPGQNNPSKFMSENTLLYAIYRMGYHSRATGHGFRATASTILNEHGFRSEVIERQLAHAERNKVRASYNHAQYLPERQKMMQWWADYLDKETGMEQLMEVSFVDEGKIQGDILQADIPQDQLPDEQPRREEIEIDEVLAKSGDTELVTVLDTKVVKALLELANLKANRSTDVVKPLPRSHGVMAPSDEGDVQQEQEPWAPQEADLDIYWLSQVFMFICLVHYKYDPRDDATLTKNLSNVGIVLDGMDGAKKRSNRTFYTTLEVACDRMKLEPPDKDTIRYYLRQGVFVTLGKCMPIKSQQRVKMKKSIYKLVGIVVRDKFLDDFYDIPKHIPHKLLRFLKD
ncbi:MAG: tyrosine-type recombinase/integrase [Proteobacteria bacterium]|nr:tyrosine-type recombinase/integrase [Pseudomonadota bacterium]